MPARELLQADGRRATLGALGKKSAAHSPETDDGDVKAHGRPSSFPQTVPPTLAAIRIQTARLYAVPLNGRRLALVPIHEVDFAGAGARRPLVAAGVFLRA